MEPLFFSQRLEVRILAVTDGQRTIENAYDELIADAHRTTLRLHLPGIAPDRLAFQRSQLPSHCSRHRLPLLTANGGCGYQRSLHSSATRPSRQAEQLGMGAAAFHVA